MNELLLILSSKKKMKLNKKSDDIIWDLGEVLVS